LDKQAYIEAAIVEKASRAPPNRWVAHRVQSISGNNIRYPVDE
jgi:hypothetical protein